MNTRFPWMILLLVTGFIGSGTSANESCNSISQQPGRISITPTDPDKNFQVRLTKSAATGDYGIDVYMTMDEECDKKGKFNGGFKIGQWNSTTTCDVKYTWDTEKNTFEFKKMGQSNVTSANFTLSNSADAPSQARVELREEGGQTKMIVSYPENVTLASETVAKECWSADKGQFQLTFDDPIEECGIVSELKGDYKVEEASANGQLCPNIPTLGETTTFGPIMPTSSGPTDTPTPDPNNPTSSGSTDTPIPDPNKPTPSESIDTTTSGSINATTKSGGGDKEEGFPNWAIAVIIIVVILLLAIVGVVIYIFYFRKPEATDEDVEEGSKEEDGEKPAQPADGTNEADGKGSSDSDPTQPGSENSKD